MKGMNEGMKENHVNDKQGIEELQEKVTNYKNLLTTLKHKGSIDDEIKKLVKVIEMNQEEQNTKIQTYEEELSMLSTQVNTLTETIFELTEKLTSLTNTLNQAKQASKTTERFSSIHKHPSMPKTPSFKQLQHLLTEPTKLERSHSMPQDQPTNRSRKTRSNSQLLNAPTKMSPGKTRPNLNQPSSKKRFSVKLASMNHNEIHMKENNAPNEEALKDIEVTSHKEATRPELKPVVEDAQSNDEQTITPPPKNNKAPSLLNFFRKNE